MATLLELWIDDVMPEGIDSDTHLEKYSEYPLASFAYGDPEKHEAYDLYYPHRDYTSSIGMLEICIVKPLPSSFGVRMTLREFSGVNRKMGYGMIIKCDVLENGYYYKIRATELIEIASNLIRD